MDNNYQNTTPTSFASHPGVVNGQTGNWVQVPADSVPYPVSNDSQCPTQGSDGSFYYEQGGDQPVGGTPQGGFGPIAANQNNAIPTPSSIVQLPPIVQPIALVPFASQNQPVVQYDPNYRPEVPRTNLEPIYKEKPYAGLTLACIIMAIVIGVLMYFVACIKGGGSALDTVFGLLTVIGLGGLTSTYYTNTLSVTFANGISAGFSDNFGQALMQFLVPIFYVIALVCMLIVLIYFIVKLAQGRTPRHFLAATLIGLIATLANVIILAIAQDVELGVGAIVIAILFLILLILPLFARKGAQVVDYTASKRLYGDPIK